MALGGVYAGRSDQLSFEATILALAQASRQHTSLATAASALIGLPADRPEPVFTTLAGGLGALPQVLAAVGGAQVRTGAMVRELTRTPAGWRLTVGSARAPEWIEADAVILALPARPVKAVTFSTVKWPHLTGDGRATGSGSLPSGADRGGSTGPPLHIVRCSLGRMGEEAVV